MTEPASGGEVLRFFGLVLAVIGALWLAFSGLCAAGMIYSMISEGALHQELLVWAVFILIISGISGAIVPLTLKRFGADPATASSIFLTTSTDIVSMGLLLGLATVMVPK